MNKKKIQSFEEKRSMENIRMQEDDLFSRWKKEKNYQYFKKMAYVTHHSGKKNLLKSHLS